MLSGRTATRNSLRGKLAVGFAIFAFVCLGCLWIDRPGLQYDETLFVAASYPNPQRGGSGFIEVRGQPVCLMVMPYLGALKGWLYRLIFEFATPSAAAVRVPVVLLGGFTLLLLFFFARRVFDAPTGVTAVVLAASDPAFLFTTRLDWGPVVLQRLCLLAGCLLLLRWRERRAARWLFAAFVVFGAGLFDKLTFAWIILALLFAGLIVFPKESTARPGWKTAGIAVAGIVAGCAPLLVYRFTSTPPALGLRWESSALPYLAKLSMLHHSLDGTIFQNWLAHVAAPQPALPDGWLARWVCSLTGDNLINPTWLPWALAAAVLILPWTLHTPHRRGVLFVLLFSISTVAVMLPVEFGGSAHHLALILPFPQLFVAASLTCAVARWGKAKPGAAFAVLAGAACLLAFTNLRAVGQQYGQILRFGGTPPWSEAIYELRDVLEASRPGSIVLLDWGIASQLRLLSSDRLPLKEAPQPAGEPRYFVEAIQQALEEPGAVYVGYESSVSGANPLSRSLLKETAEAAGRRLRRARLVRDAQTRPIFEILAAE